MGIPLKISAKALGELALADFCPRCFWVRLKCQNHLPFQKFPGIAMIIDSFTKKMVRGYFESNNEVPLFLKPFGELAKPVQVPHHSKFFFNDKDTEIRFTGVPDDIFLIGDSSFVIADYKCARMNENQTAILPMYEAQLNGYALIAEENGYNPISKLGLIYFEPQNRIPENIESVTMDKGFSISFHARFLEVELAPDRIIPPLLREARRLFDMAQPPSSSDGCKDCENMNHLATVIAEEQNVE